MAKGCMILGVFLLLTMLEVPTALACKVFNVEAVRIELCGSLASGNFSYEFKAAGIPVASGAMTPFYINEKGVKEEDNSFLIASFPLVQPPTVVRFKVRVLKKFRNDSTGFFGPAGRVIYAQAIWRNDHAPECILPKLNDMGSNCWDESGWRHLGDL